MKPVIYQTQQTLDGAQLPEDLPWQRFTTDWFGHPLDFEASYQLIQDPAALYFSARSDLPAPPDPSAPAGAFVEGLWNNDVAEVFLRAPASPSAYQEWNLSPSGAWWSQGFQSVREPQPGFPRPTGVRTWSQDYGAQGWRATLALPCSWTNWERGGINVTMILRPPQGERCYVSCVPVPDKAPDFHLPAQYPSPEIRAYSSGSGTEL